MGGEFLNQTFCWPHCFKTRLYCRLDQPSVIFRITKEKSKWASFLYQALFLLSLSHQLRTYFLLVLIASRTFISECILFLRRCGRRAFRQIITWLFAWRSWTNTVAWLWRIALDSPKSLRYMNHVSRVIVNTIWSRRRQRYWFILLYEYSMSLIRLYLSDHLGMEIHSLKV